MKKILLIILFSLISTYSYAQSSNDSNKKTSFFENNSSDYPMTIGGSVGAYFPDEYIDTGIGVAGAVKYKFNFNRFLGISTDLGYTYSSKKYHKNNLYSVYDTKTHNIADIRIMAVLQYETKKGETGIAPWFGLGTLFSIGNTNIHSVTDTITLEREYTSAEFGFIVGFGFRYNFKKAYIGANFDYSIAKPYGYDISGIRFFTEAGYRF